MHGGSAANSLRAMALTLPLAAIAQSAIRAHGLRIATHATGRDAPFVGVIWCMMTVSVPAAVEAEADVCTVYTVVLKLLPIIPSPRERLPCSLTLGRSRGA